MKIVNSIKDLKAYLAEAKQDNKKIGFVPTMGALHNGHLSLVQHCVKNNDVCVVSVFVNPTQFNDKHDLETYPRTLEADCVLLESAGCDYVFAPSVEEMYPEPDTRTFDLGTVSEVMEGAKRPGHFNGVAQVVSKLFYIVEPDNAYFGEKDAQQLAVIRRMVLDLNMDVEIVGCPIVREADGLAKSSRNTYLSPEERKAALVLSRSIFAGKKLAESGETDAAKLVQAMTEIIEAEPLAKIDYVKVVDLMTMQQIPKLDRPFLAAMAVYIGKTRLIDNFMMQAGGAAE